MPELTRNTQARAQPRVEILDRLPERVDTLASLETLSYLMDRCFELPGSRVRFGINSLLLFIPVLGDAVASMISFYILTVGLSSHRVPRIVAARMVLSSLLDALISGVPLLGNLWDVYFKADSRNVALLREYANRADAPSTWQHWAFVVSVLALLIGLLALLVVGSVLLVSALFKASGPAG